MLPNLLALKEPISITSISSVSALGNTQKEIWKNYLHPKHFFSQKVFQNSSAWVAALPNAVRKEIEELRTSEIKYKKLDDSVLYAIFVSRNASQQAGWEQGDSFGVNFGSSRGATQLFEKYHTKFLEYATSSTPVSPLTTLGNLSSWVAHDLKSRGPEISHSITCSTALHAVLNGVAWIQSGLTDKFLVGGTEASLTEFTIAQMKAMKIYAKPNPNINHSTIETYPCRALDLNKKSNTMIMGEGASAICLEKGNPSQTIAKIAGIGYASEPLKHGASMSSNADCLQQSMKMALKAIDPSHVDVVVMHAPGTIKGDISELKAISRIFCNKKPFLTTNKWKLGHTFGASGMLSLELGVQMLQHQQVIAVPFYIEQQRPKKLQNVLINAVGFGGNAVSILLTK